MKKKKKKFKKVINWTRLFIISAVGSLVTVMFINAYMTTKPSNATMSYNTFMEYAETGLIEKINIVKTLPTFNATLLDGQVYSVINPDTEEFKKDILEMGIEIEVQQKTIEEAIISVLLALPLSVVSLALLIFVLNSLNLGNSALFKVFQPEEVVTFDDVAGMSETKEEVKFAVEMLRNHNKLKELGARPINGIILEGPPGTGKTLLAKAIAGEAGVPFISTSGADFVQMFVGLGATRVRQLWNAAILNAPCVVFIDEIDAVGKRRTSSSDGGNQEHNQTLNALLQKMDGLDGKSGILVIGATNRIDDLDSALLRPGRFDKKLYVGVPRTKEDRLEIVNLYLDKKKKADDVNAEEVARILYGLSGAQIENVLNEAVMVSLQEKKDGVVDLECINKAFDKLVMNGIAVKHINEEDRKIAATHEAGHAIIARHLKYQVNKVSIIPYSSGVGGMTITDMNEESSFSTESSIKKAVMQLYGGYTAEKMLCGGSTSGAESDIKRATEIVYNAYMNQGIFGNKINMNVIKDNLHIINEDSILKEINKVIEYCIENDYTILRNNYEELIRLRDELLDKEVVLNYEY